MENVTFRLPAAQKRALARLAAEENKPVGAILREAVEAHIARQERVRWEAEARHASEVLAREAKAQASAEAAELRLLDAHMEELAAEWIWDGGE